MLARPLPSALPWWAAVARLALAARLLFLFGADEPLLYSHPYNYFHGALRHPRAPATPGASWPPATRGTSGSGPGRSPPSTTCSWPGPWPCSGRISCPSSSLQIGLDVAGRRPDRRPGPAHGRAAGRVGGRGLRRELPRHRAVRYHAHREPRNVLLLAGIVLLIEEARARAPRMAGARAGGLLLGLSALARAVATAFVPLAGLWRWRWGATAAAFMRAVLICARRRGRDRALDDPQRDRDRRLHSRGDQRRSTTSTTTTRSSRASAGARQEARHALAAHAWPSSATWRCGWPCGGSRAAPAAFVEKAWRNLLHFVRPDGLQLLLVVEEPHAGLAPRRAGSSSTTSSCCPRSCSSPCSWSRAALSGAGD